MISNVSSNASIGNNFLEDTCTNITVTQKYAPPPYIVISHPCAENKISNMLCEFPKPLAVIFMNKIHDVI